MTARITYNGKNIDFVKPNAIYIDPFVPRIVNATLRGDTETVFLPRVDVHVQVNFTKNKDAALRAQIHAWWQWAQQGNPFRFVLDTTKTVKTTITGQEAAGQTVLTVASPTGIMNGQQYVLIGGPNYQLVTVSGISGSDITISSSLDFTFAAGSVFRDQYLWDGIIRDAEQHTPIRDLFDPEPPGTWEFNLDFFEDVL